MAKHHLGMSKEPQFVNGILRRSRALEDGWADHEIRRLRMRGELCRLARGSYVSDDALRRVDDVGRHRLRIAALLPRLAADAVISHQSAAVLHNLPLWQTPLDRVHITRDRDTGGRARTSTIIYANRLHGAVVEVDGYRVTSPARTVADLARTLPFESALVVGDAAVRDYSLTPEDLGVELDRAARRVGVAGARRAVAAMDGASESPGESRSRAFFYAQQLPVPDLQVQIRDVFGKVIARVDFLWQEQRLIGEFDGKVKYGRLLRPGEEPGDVVYREKLREDRLTELGFRVIRWGWADLANPTALADRIRRALRRR